MSTQSTTMRTIRAAALYSLLLLLPGMLAAQNEGETAMLDGQMWALSTNGEYGTWEGADSYCRNLELAGHDDWRLPPLDELKSRYDPQRPGNVFIEAPLPQSACCLWSATTLVDLMPEEGHFYTGPLGEPEEYAWGFLFSEEGTEYYSVKFMPDGQALCVRDP